MNRSFLSVLLVLSLHCSVGLAALPTMSIDTTPTWTGGGAAPLGGNGVSTYGQSFLVPSYAPTLESFAFYIDEHDNGPPVSFRAYVAPWDNLSDSLSGPFLFVSAVTTSTNNQGAGGWERIEFDTNSLLLNANETYIAFLATFGLFDSIDEELKAGLVNGNPYSDGRFYFFAANANTAQLDSLYGPNNDWAVLTSSGDNRDLATVLVFSVPEPSTALYLVLALLVLLGRVALNLRRASRWHLRSQPSTAS